MQNCELKLCSEVLTEDQLQAITRDTVQLLDVPFGASLKATEAAPGQKSGELWQLGEIVLAFISSGAALALIEALRPIFDRSSSLKVKVKRPDGAEFELSAEKVRGAQVQILARSLGKFLTPQKS